MLTAAGTAGNGRAKEIRHAQEGKFEGVELDRNVVELMLTVAELRQRLGRNLVTRMRIFIFDI